MKIRLSRRAFSDLEEIFSYIARDNPVAAAAVVDRVQVSIALLADFPDIGHLTDRADFRVLPAGRYPYLIFYEVASDAIVIHRVRHAARQQPWHRA
jgi:toxin ParE1/3/4